MTTPIAADILSSTLAVDVAVDVHPASSVPPLEWAVASIEAGSVHPDRSAVVPLPTRCTFGGGVEHCGKPVDEATLFVDMSDGSIAGTAYCAGHMVVMREAIDVWRERRDAAELAAARASADAGG